MAQITINEISQNYTYNIGSSAYATVALPITSCWGPGYLDSDSDGKTTEEELESLVWNRFPANQTGLESFVSTFRGPISNYRLLQDYSYQIAMTLLTAGYDILVCRLAAGSQAQTEFEIGEKTFTVKAKYVGTFGNKLRCVMQKVQHYNRWNLITYIVDDSGVQTAVENVTFVFELDNSTDSILHVGEVESNFVELVAEPGILDTQEFEASAKRLEGGTDLLSPSDALAATVEGGRGVVKALEPTPENLIGKAIEYAKIRYIEVADEGDPETADYIITLNNLKESIGEDVTKANTILFKEWCYTSAYQVLGTLEDKLAYNPNRVIVPGWDDQDICYLTGSTKSIDLNQVSPLHAKLMEVAYFSRCATAYIDIPKSLSRQFVYNDSEKTPGYAQKLARIQSDTVNYDLNTSYYPSHSALFAPWGKYTYAGTSKQYAAPPSFLALMIERAMILNQTSQYEWQLPTTRRHNLRIGKLDYNISKKYLDEWQSLEGVGVNCITSIPELGVSIWGNSTLFEVPPATYQALANLSTRKLVNAVEDLAYRCGISITFNYNNDQAYNAFYAGLTPLLDTMINVGAIEDYYLRMAEDVNGLDQVNANSVVGKIYLVVDGVINDIAIDLIALPPESDLNQYRS